MRGQVTGQGSLPNVNQAKNLTREELLEAMSKINTANATSIVLDCQPFNGDSTDKHAFEAWYAQFDTVVKANPTWDDKTQLTYLKSKIQGNAKNHIRAIKLEIGGFDQAIAALRKRYSNKEHNKDQLFLKITNARPSYCPDYSKTEHFISEMHATLLDLKNYYGIDLLTPGSGGYAYVSHLIFYRLSHEIQGTLVTKLNKNFPTFHEIYDNYIEVISNLNKFKRKKSEYKDFSDGTKGKKQFTPFSDTKNVQQTENFASNANPVKSGNEIPYHCRFCGTDGHASSYCRTYAKLEARQKKCVELGLCSLCTKSTHTTESCYGKNNKLNFPCRICKSRAHVAAMCDNKKVVKTEQTHVCLSTNLQNQSNYLLPIISMQMQGHDGTLFKFNCLLDTASSRTYISQAISDKLNLNSNLCKDVEYQVKTF